MTPAWEPVNERASCPRLAIAMASSAIEIRSPAVSSMSSSRGVRQRRDLLGEVDQLVGGVAHRRDHDGRRRDRPCDGPTIRWATCLMRSASLTEEPPYFWTTSATGASSHPGNGDVATPEFTGAFPRPPAGPHRGPLRPVGGDVRVGCAVASRVRPPGSGGSPLGTGAGGWAPRRSGRTRPSRRGTPRHRRGGPAGPAGGPCPTMSASTARYIGLRT